MRFGISTHLYHGHRLALPHLEAIARRGFEAIELFATRSHFDYHDRRAIENLRSWLEATGLSLHSIHAPIGERLAGGGWARVYSNASADRAARQLAVQETLSALEVAREIPVSTLVMHLGRPTEQAGAGDNDAAAGRRSLEEITLAASELNVQTAVEVIGNELSEPAALVELLEGDLDLPAVGACLDFGHAFLLGDLVDAIENLSGHIVTTHVHDNHGKSDDHLAPYEGAIDWSSALFSMKKIGYEGIWLLEVADTGDAEQVLDRAVAARREFERVFGEQ